LGLLKREWPKKVLALLYLFISILSLVGAIFAKQAFWEWAVAYCFSLAMVGFLYFMVATLFILIFQLAHPRANLKVPNKVGSSAARSLSQ
jgi:hypothetical protein